MTVHITGAGVVGCVLMRRLFQAGIEFTWSDTDAAVTAWKASTGSVCRDHTDSPEVRPAWERFAAECVPDDQYCLVPHYRAFISGEHRTEWHQEGDSYHLDVQSFVLRTREAWKQDRREERDPDSINIMTVGHAQCEKFWWGWSVLVEVPGLERASWSLRVVRQIRYLYPKPGTPLFYAGSSIMQQRTPKELNLQTHLSWWQREWGLMSPDGSDYSIKTEPVCGWRPVGSPGVWKLDVNGDYVISPMSASGVKFAPLVAEQIVKSLRERL